MIFYGFLSNRLDYLSINVTFDFKLKTKKMFKLQISALSHLTRFNCNNAHLILIIKCLLIHYFCNIVQTLYVTLHLVQVQVFEKLRKMLVLVQSLKKYRQTARAE